MTAACRNIDTHQPYETNFTGRLYSGYFRSLFPLNPSQLLPKSHCQPRLELVAMCSMVVICHHQDRSGTCF